MIAAVSSAPSFEASLRRTVVCPRFSLNQATQQNAAASEELVATAEQMGGQAAQLQALMEFFKIDDQRVDAGDTARRLAPQA